MDYLYRDSLHAGVPYGRHFDRNRLVASLCVNESGDGLAINSKGKTAAELMVFARYVMFSEVYWHHAVRSATAMLQRAFYRLRDQFQDREAFGGDEHSFRELLISKSHGQSVEGIVSGLFGPTRKLYKRLAQFSHFDDERIYGRIARKPYAWLVQCSDRLAEIVSQELGKPVPSDHILIDAPPVGLEVEFNVQVQESRVDKYRPLGDVSPVVKALAQRQFDDFVKRVRIFAHPSLAESLAANAHLEAMLTEAIQDSDQSD